MGLLAALPLIDKVLGFIPNPNERAEVRAKLEAAEQRGELDLALGQMGVNKQEAAHNSIFVAGWRPFIGWVCGAGLAYNVVLNPILSTWFEMPPVDPAMLYPVLMGMLGMGGLRTYEKYKGVSREK
jgi:hypothetical protein